MTAYLPKLITEFCTIMEQLDALTHQLDPSEGYFTVEFNREDISTANWSKRFPTDVQSFGLVYFAISGTMYVCTEEPEKGAASEIYQTYMDLDGDQTFAGSDIKLKDVLIIGYSAHAFHVYGYHIANKKFKFLDTHGAASYFELIVDAATQVFENLMHPVFLTENGINNHRVDILLSRLGRWYGSLEAEKLTEYVDKKNSKNWIGQDLYHRRLMQHQSEISQLKNTIALIKDKLIDLEKSGFKVTRKKRNLSEVSANFSLSYKLFLSEVGEVSISNNNRGKANKLTFEIFSPLNKKEFSEIQKRQDFQVKFDDSELFIKLPTNKISLDEILFVGQYKSEVGAFQTNKYLQFPFVINTDFDQKYPSDSFLDWVLVCIDSELSSK